MVLDLLQRVPQRSNQTPLFLLTGDHYSIVFQDDSLELKWDSDNDEENEDVPLNERTKTFRGKIGKKWMKQVLITQNLSAH